jgi:catechol 2,3-dioxygenase-like lactoylglutathione lyase family enzyme
MTAEAQAPDAVEMEFKLEVVVIPVSDVDRAKAFYSERCGFHVDVDQQMGPVRVVQLTPPGSACSVTIGVGLTKSPPGCLEGLQLVVADIDAARDLLVGRGVDCTPVRHVENGEWLDGHGGPWNSFVFFSDPDGNGWAIQEKPAG